MIDLQVSMDCVRELPRDPEQYDKQLARFKHSCDWGTRTGPYWLALVQYDDGRFRDAFNWFTRRVLDDEQRSYLEDAAIYTRLVRG